MISIFKKKTKNTSNNTTIIFNNQDKNKMEKSFRATKESTMEITKKRLKIITKKKQTWEMRNLSRSNSVIKTKKVRLKKNILKMKWIISLHRKR
jgi:hypothetical protein